MDSSNHSMEVRAWWGGVDASHEGVDLWREAEKEVFVEGGKELRIYHQVSENVLVSWLSCPMQAASARNTRVLLKVVTFFIIKIIHVHHRKKWVGDIILLGKATAVEICCNSFQSFFYSFHSHYCDHELPVPCSCHLALENKHFLSYCHLMCYNCNCIFRYNHNINYCNLDNYKLFCSMCLAYGWAFRLGDPL